MSLLDVRNIHKSYDNGVEILRNVNFSMERKECLGLVGRAAAEKAHWQDSSFRLNLLTRAASYLKGPSCKTKVNAV